MSKAFGTAVKWQIIPTNPVRDAERPKTQTSEQTPSAVAQLLALLHAAERTQWEVPLLLALTTGARRFEALAFRWSDVSFDKRRLHVTRSLQQLNADVYFAEPKTNADTS